MGEVAPIESHQSEQYSKASVKKGTDAEGFAEECFEKSELTRKMHVTLNADTHIPRYNFNTLIRSEKLSNSYSVPCQGPGVKGGF